MAQMGHPGLSAVQKAELWQRWKHGQALSEIGRALGKHAGGHGVPDFRLRTITEWQEILPKNWTA